MHIKVKVWKFLGLLFTVIFALSAAHVAHAVGVVGTIPVGSHPVDVAYDSGKNEIFVTNYDGARVSVISDSNNTVIANVTAQAGPYGLAYDSGKGEIFIINHDSSSVSVISDSNNTVVATVTVGAMPLGAAYDSGKGEIFVTNANSKSVSVISDSNNTVVATVTVGNSPAWVAYDSGKGEIFVANYGDNTVSVISDRNNTVVATVPAGIGPEAVAYDSGKGEIFVSNRGSNTVSVISDSSNTVVATVSGIYQPWGVAYDSGKGEIFVTNYGDNTVSVISDTTNAVVANVIVGNNPVGVAYDSGKGEIFVANDVVTYGTVSVISDSANLVAPSVSSSPGAVDQGQTSSLTSAVTTGAAPYKYHWFIEAPGVSSYSSIGGANSSSYNFVTSTSTATGNWSFILQVADATGAVVNSTAATVMVNVAPTVSITPASSTMDVGQSHVFTSSVTGGTSPYSYKWYLNAVANGTSSSWTFTPSSAGSYGVYVNVTDSGGVRSKSNVASVTVNAAPSVTVSPSSVNVNVGQSRTFNASVSGGASPYSYQWYLNGSLVSGATSSSWTFKPTSTGVYIIYVKTTDALNDVVQSSNVQVKVTAAGLGLLGIALVGVVVAAVVCAGAIVYKMRKRPKKPPLTPPPPAPTKLMIQAEPTEILADGKTKSTITVQLQDDSNRLMAALADTEVKITTTLGTLETPVVRIPKGKDTEKTVITSSTESGLVTVSASGLGLKTMSTTINFLEKKRFCMHCGALIPFRATRCPKCGRTPPAGLDTKVCKNCNAVVPVVAKFCSECGAGQPE
jgi:YVTN family beta-propeller protein